MLEALGISTVAGVTRHFYARTTSMAVLRNVSLQVSRGETLGILGESGSGKSMLARTLAGLHAPVSGTVTVDGVRLTGTGRTAADVGIQIVFQDPKSSLDPRMSIEEIVLEPTLYRPQSPDRNTTIAVGRLLEMVGLPQALMYRRPHELSGGQRQRVAIARALSIQPSYIIFDEATSALDPTVQRAILTMLNLLQTQLRLGYVVISHQVRVVRAFCDRVCVLHRGEIVESGSVEDVLEHPRAEATRHLIEPEPAKGARPRVSNVGTETDDI